MAAVGGAIEPAAGQRLVDWAVYFCRYAPYMKPLAGGAEPDIAADNAVYQADILRCYEPLWQEAFSEPFVHQAMRADGHVLALRPDLIVRHVGGGSVRGFARQRYLHGRAFGELRANGQGLLGATVASLSAPLVPLVMTGRAARQVCAKRRYRARFALVLPLLLWFYGWWAAGEVVGRVGEMRRRTGMSQVRGRA
jgi:hypothetical protein